MEKVKAIFSDEAFVESLFALETVAEVQAALKEKGAELTEEEIIAVRDVLARVEAGEIDLAQLKLAEEGELSEEQLESVAGGGNELLEAGKYILTIVSAICEIVAINMKMKIKW